eukprot:2650545-Rhodomonas_salina.2
MQFHILLHTVTPPPGVTKPYPVSNVARGDLLDAPIIRPNLNQTGATTQAGTGGHYEVYGMISSPGAYTLSTAKPQPPYKVKRRNGTFKLIPG